MTDKALELKPHIPPYTTWPEGMASGIIIISAALAAVGTTLLILRIFTRFYLRGHKNVGWSLAFALISWSFAVPTSVLFALSAHYGLGNHYDTVKDSPNLTKLLLYEWTAVALSMAAAWFGKVSALAYVLEVQGPTHNRRKWFIISVVGINLITYAIMIPAIFLQCNPASSLWRDTARQHCSFTAGMRTFYLATVTGAWGAFTDLALALYPSSLIWSLQMQTRMKLALSVLLGLGVFTAACAILKTILFCAFQATQLDFDSTFDNAGFVFWSLAELWVILIAACVPALWPLFRRIAMKTDASGKRHWRLASSRYASAPAEKGASGSASSGKKRGFATGGKGWTFRIGSNNASNDSSEGNDSNNQGTRERGGGVNGEAATNEKFGATILPIVAETSNDNSSSSQAKQKPRVGYGRDGIWKGAASAGPGAVSPTKAEERSAARRYFHEYRSRPRGDPLGELGMICGINESDLTLTPAAGNAEEAKKHRHQQRSGSDGSIGQGTGGNATTTRTTLPTTTRTAPKFELLDERIPAGTTVTVIP